jgi:hypothetical protein
MRIILCNLLVAVPLAGACCTAVGEGAGDPPSTMPAEMMSDADAIKIAVADLCAQRAEVPANEPVVAHGADIVTVTWYRQLAKHERGDTMLMRISIDRTTRKVIKREVGV